MPRTRPVDTSNVATKFTSIVCEQLGVDESEVTSDAHFEDDLGADSLDLVELVMACEEEFGIEIDDDDTEKLRRVRDAVAYLERRMEKPKPKETKETQE